MCVGWLTGLITFACFDQRKGQIGLDHGFHCRWTVTLMSLNLLAQKVLYDLVLQRCFGCFMSHYTLFDSQLNEQKPR